MSTFRRKTRTSSKPTVFTSSDIASLDDTLGLLVIAPDTHSSNEELGVPSTAVRTVEDNDETDHEPKVTIAWRYENLKRFQTAVSTSKPSTNDFCQVFDLTQRIPPPFLDQAKKSSQLELGLINVIAESLGASSQDAVPIRICISLLGSPGWGDLQPKVVLYFAYSLRTLLRRYPHACASVSLPPNIPLPAPHSLIPASDRSSTLRGISSVSGWTGGGEDNLGFKRTRKRFVIETHHLDVEGGVGERRTTPAGITWKPPPPRACPRGDEGRGKKVTFWGERAGPELGW
ncbi:hypothetical protein EDB85DRAFT_2075794 [Lactarius pseudohatsudake]|nr:hypothetical protein EDB85DRAFT_2075794 [Lactarius pseudohatsudake]